MAADIVNLNKARKARSKAGTEQRASENRARFGRSKAERQREETAAEFARRQLAGLKRDRNAKPADGTTGDGDGGENPA